MTMLTATRGFTDPVHDAQAVFRTVMEALARPGTIGALPLGVSAPAPLAAGAAALALTLCDFETKLWLDPVLSAAEGVADYLRFHTGARLTADPAEAAFAIAADLASLPALEAFALGTLDDPDRSTTLILQVAGLDAGMGWRLRGPGIAGSTRFQALGLPPRLLAQRTALHPLFPRGIDLVFVAGPSLAALPRTTVVEA